MKHSDEFVTSLVEAHLKGVSILSLAVRNNISVNTVKKWCNGQNRQRCLRAAKLRYRKWLLSNA